MKTLTNADATAMMKDMAGIKAKWLTAGACADETMRDAAIAEYRAYIDMLAMFGISIAHVEAMAA